MKARFTDVAVDSGERADAIVALLEALGRHPHLRLGQLIVSVLPDEYGSDPFYIGDAKLAELLNKF